VKREVTQPRYLVRRVLTAAFVLAMVTGFVIRISEGFSHHVCERDDGRRSR
jgi:hypothetical protein